MPSLTVSLLFSLFLSSAVGSPLEVKAEARAKAAVNPFCAIVDLAATKLHQQAAATSYCSSYLSITTPATVTSTVTASNIVTSYGGSPTFPSSQDDSCYVDAPAQKRRAHVVADMHAAARQPAPAAGAGEPRGNKAVVAKPACFGAFNAAPLISSACKCLSIPVLTAPKTTVTATATGVVTIHPTSDNFVIRDSVTNMYALISDSSAPNGATFSFTARTAATATIFFSRSVCGLQTQSIRSFVWFTNDGTGGNMRYYSSYPGGSYTTFAFQINRSSGVISFRYTNSLYSCVDSSGLWSLLNNQGVSGYTYHTLIAEAVGQSI